MLNPQKKRCGGQFGHTVSNTVRQKLRICNLGKKQSLETIEKKKKSIRGLKRTPETCEKLRKIAKGYWETGKLNFRGPNHPMWKGGVYLS